MRLYHHPMSSNARRAVMTAVHLGLKPELVLVDLARGEQRTPDYRRLNPDGRVPVLEDDGFLLTESHAIMQYLCDRTPGQTLYPEGLRPRAEVNRWLFWSAQHFQPAVSVLGWENVVKPMIGLGAADPVEVKRGLGLVTECARVLDAHLAGKQWVAQDQLTLADLALAASLMVMVPARLPLADHGHIQSWLRRVQGLEAWQTTGA